MKAKQPVDLMTRFEAKRARSGIGLRGLAVLGLLAGLPVLALLAGSAPAGATVGSVTPAGDGHFPSGSTLAITVVAQDDEGMLTIVAAGAVNPTLTVVNCGISLQFGLTAATPTTGGNCVGAIKGDGTSTVTI